MALERVDVENCRDRLQVVLHRGRYDFVLSRLPRGLKVLEIGVGTATFTKELLPLCDRYVGIEYDADACRLAREKTAGQAEIIQADARNLPFGQDEFSFIVCLEVLEHLGDWRSGVRNIHRCLNPTGLAIVSVPWRRIGGQNKMNEHHPYEPGENELVLSFRELFGKVEVYYQYFEETWWMTLARQLHFRKFVGLAKVYSDLSAGTPWAAAKLHIDEKSGGMNTNLILVASSKK